MPITALLVYGQGVDVEPITITPDAAFSAKGANGVQPGRVLSQNPVVEQSTEPTNIYYVWYDTSSTPATIKQYNLANSTWEVIGLAGEGVTTISLDSVALDRSTLRYNPVTGQFYQGTIDRVKATASILVSQSAEITGVGAIESFTAYKKVGNGLTPLDINDFAVVYDSVAGTVTITNNSGTDTDVVIIFN